ncbi:MAG: class I SAM-dependent methyltransferase [Deltaproteobacteria bacterium]|nr:class I SAM-dependent methyltransferase [Deltaproteobacteria bacterium]
MSSDIQYIVERIPRGKGIALDLGGGKGLLRAPLEKLGYQYINLENRPVKNRDVSIVSDAHDLPFKNQALDLLISKDTLEHFADPSKVITESYRVLKHKGLFIIWVPFMHPFHGDDLYRYTPLGLRRLLRNFDIVSFDNPLWVFTIIGTAWVQIFKRIGLKCLEKPVKHICMSIDHLFTRKMNGPSAFAPSYRIVARKKTSSAPFERST